MPAMEKDYVLGTHDEEIARLGLQHSVWRPYATAAWRRAGFRRGQTIVDLGCGPGWATMDLADLVGPVGRVHAIDRSRRFLDALSARGASQVTTYEQDLAQGALPFSGADGLWARWVFAFVPGPRDLLERAVSALKPGGTIVLHEYLDYRTWRLFPTSEVFEEFVQEVMSSWRANGGEPDIGPSLAQWLPELGVEVKSLIPIQETVRAHDPLCAWPDAFIGTGVDRLVKLGRITPEKGKAIHAAYAQHRKMPNAFQSTPSVLEIIGVKRSG
jgi:SAM-dependent methyltransferase